MVTQPMVQQVIGKKQEEAQRRQQGDVDLKQLKTIAMTDELKYMVSYKRKQN